MGWFGRRAGICCGLAVAWLAVSAAPARAQAACPVAAQNLFVRNVMTDLYLWSESVPDVDPTAFSSPDAYLAAIRYLPLDSHYSYIESRAVSEAFYSDSQFIGFGFSSSLEAAAIRVAQVFPGSPAEDAGLLRGDRIVAVDGRGIAELIAAGLIGGVFGPATEGVARELTFTRGTARQSARLVKRVVTIPTVSHTRVFQVGSRTVGYLFFRNFVEPSFAALDEAFASLKAQGVNELILDLRYNGGGMVTVAQYLAGLIGGARTAGQVLGTYAHNARNTFRNSEIRMDTHANALGLDRLIVIASGSSASASELVVNGLRPFMPVAIIGDRTYGKPVGQYAIPFCDKILAPVSFSIRNANDEGDYYDGLPATCPAADDLDHQLGDAAEASLAEALNYVATGACTTPPSASPLSRRARARPAATGLQLLIQAD
ncbi:MAG: S41 family peptidase [Vicinamibacterales bacterium]